MAIILNYAKNQTPPLTCLLKAPTSPTNNNPNKRPQNMARKRALDLSRM